MEKKYAYTYNGSRLASQHPLTEREMLDKVEISVSSYSAKKENYTIYELVPVEMKEVTKLSLERA